MLRDEPNVELGQEIVLKIEGRETNWTVVGVVEGGSITATAFINYPAFAEAVREIGSAQWLAVVTEQHNPAYWDKVTSALENQFDYIGLNIDMMVTIAEERSEIEMIFQAIVALLLIMAVLLAVVGGLGLTGTMSINVLERQREIGVMRSIGASNGAILKIVIVEGVIIGLLSWLAGSLLAIPLSSGLAYAVGQAFLQTPLSYEFSVEGAGLWLGLVIILASLASFLPARRASQLTVREVLVYE